MIPFRYRTLILTIAALPLILPLLARAQDELPPPAAVAPPDATRKSLLPCRRALG